MTRSHIARQLLKHGPLTLREFKAVTGWPPRQAEWTLQSLRRTRKAVRFVRANEYVYRLAE